MKWAAWLAGLSTVAWIIPIIGIPMSITALVLAGRAQPRKAATIATTLALITLVIGVINATIGAIQGYQRAAQTQQQAESATRGSIEASTPSQPVTDEWAYPSEYEDNYLMACMNSGGKYARCQCTLRYIQANYSYAEISGYEARGSYPAELTRSAVTACQ